QFLQVCIRALDYCPPADLNFGDYLRALITADHDLVPNDPWGYRVAIAESFRKRAIFPSNLATFGEETLLWRAPEDPAAVNRLFQSAGRQLERLGTQFVHIDPGPGELPIPDSKVRGELFAKSRNVRASLHDALAKYIGDLTGSPERDTEREVLGRQLGIDL